MAVLDRPSDIGFSLWVSDPLPLETAQWHKLDGSPDRNALERQAKSLISLITMRKIVIVDGQSPPQWKPKL
jgi:hypothetical protein